MIENCQNKGEKNENQTKIVFISIKNEKKMLYLKQFDEDVELVKKLFPDMKDPIDPAMVLLALIEAVQTPNYLKDHVSEIRSIVPLCMSGAAKYLDAPSATLKRYIKTLHAEQKNDIREYNEFSTIQSIIPVLSRSESKIELSEKVSCQLDTTLFLKDIASKIERQYNRLWSECALIKVHSYRPQVRDPLVKMIFSDFRVYPILPALFALDAIKQVFKNEKVAKAKLIQSNTELPILKGKVNELNHIYKNEKLLFRGIQNILLSELDILYQPVKVYYFQEDECSFLLNASMREKRESKHPEQINCKPFGVLLCKTDKMAFDLAMHCKLPYEKIISLREKLPQFLADFKEHQNDLEQQYGSCATSIIKVLATLSKSDIYASGNRLNDILFESLKKCTKSEKMFFSPNDEKDANSSMMNCSNDQIQKAYNFLKKYFYNVRLSRRVMACASYALPLSGNKSAFPSYYGRLIRDFIENAEDTIYDEDALNEDLGFSIKCMRDEGTFQIPRYLKCIIKEHMTTQHAIDILKQHNKMKKPTNIKKLKEHEQALLNALDLSEKGVIDNYLLQGNGAILLLYQFLLKVSCDIIGHYSAIILLRCNTMRLENMNSMAEEDSKSTGIYW